MLMPRCGRCSSGCPRLVDSNGDLLPIVDGLTVVTTKPTCRPTVAEMKATATNFNSTTTMFDENSSSGDEFVVRSWTVPGSCSPVLVDIRPHIQIFLDRQERPFFLEFHLTNTSTGASDENRFVRFQGTEHDSLDPTTYQQPSTDSDEVQTMASLCVEASGGDTLQFKIVLIYSGNIATNTPGNDIELSQTYIRPIYTFEAE